MSCNVDFELCSPADELVIGVLDVAAGTTSYHNQDGTPYAGDVALLTRCSDAVDLLANDGDVGVSRALVPATDVLIHDGNVQASAQFATDFPGCTADADGVTVYKTTDGRLVVPPPPCGKQDYSRSDIVSVSYADVRAAYSAGVAGDSTLTAVSFGSPLTAAINNDTCYDQSFDMQITTHHAQINTAGDIGVGWGYAIGTNGPPANQTAVFHQLWRTDSVTPDPGNFSRFDTHGTVTVPQPSTAAVVLAPGQSRSVTVQPVWWVDIALTQLIDVTNTGNPAIQSMRWSLAAKSFPVC